MVNKVDSMKLEAGDNCSLNAFVHYLDAVYLGLFFMTESHDVGTITLNNSVATFYSTKLGKNLYSVEVYDTYGLLRYLNKVGIRMILKSSNATPYKKTPIPQNKIWSYVKEINKTIRNKIVALDISSEALALSLRISVNMLDNILYGVINYDMKIVDLIAKRIGTIALYHTKQYGTFTTKYIGNKLYGVHNDKQSGRVIEFEIVIGEKHKITDLAFALSKMQFVKLQLAKDVISNNYIGEQAKNDIIDSQSKRSFHLYKKYELEELIKWRKIGYVQNCQCDYCGIKGTTRLYETKDGRDICLCRLCTDKIHPTNNYVKIIYTPVGGKNR